MHIESGNIRIKREPPNWKVEVLTDSFNKDRQPVKTWQFEGWYGKLEHVANHILENLLPDTPEGETIAEQITALIADVEAARVEFLAGLKTVK